MRRLLALAAVITLGTLARAQWAAGFSSTTIADGWVQPTGILFAPDGRMFVWEKAGLVWVVTNGVKSAQPVLDISEEVGNWGDYGLLGFALDPAFARNGRVYLSYVVDHHHLVNFGAPAYDPLASTTFRDTIGRVTRYALDVQSPALTMVPGSRAVLVGESQTTGIPICNHSHGVGSLVFGEDGTLLVATGDGASFAGADVGGTMPGSSNTALQDGIIQPKENVGAFRAQLVDSLSGKILRIDPATGDGVASNPFYDPGSPRAPRSRVWALGLRNPFRMALQPGTGAGDPAAGDPGTFWVGDVGWNSWEETDVCDAPGLNFGWPIYEGLEASPPYAVQTTANADAPNPLFGIGGCGLPSFRFVDLLVQDTLATPSWPNPCDAAQQVPASVPRFEHRRPLLDWFHSPFGPARTGIHQGTQAAVIAVDAPGSPIDAGFFGGQCSMGGAWVSGSAYPAQWRDSYYFADFTHGWIQHVVTNAQGAPVAIERLGMGGEIPGIVCLASDPVGGELCFIRYVGPALPQPEIRRIVFTPNAAPTAVAKATPRFGPAPLVVHFSAAASTDPENQALAYEWDFGDGATSTEAEPYHIYYAESDITAQGTIIARTFELVPPHPLGAGSQDPEVIRDGDTPPAGSTDVARQYDTFHAGAQGDLDWIGYAFPSTRTFHALVFQEGVHASSGGWFDQLRVQVGDGTTWSLASSLQVTPQYGGAAGESFATYRLDFAPAAGTHVRLVGNPGGSAGFISVGELRVIADDPALAGTPIRRDVSLTVRDPHGVPHSTTLVVSLNNTPPVVSITSPVDGSTYPVSATTTPALTALVTDAEHSGPQLSCAWQTTLHHDDHSHPEPIDPLCTTSTVLPPVGCDGPTYWYEVELTVTDAAGLTGEDRVSLFPACTPEIVCTGDGSGTACPCGNDGDAGHGCASSTTPGGALLTASGSARVSSDTLLLAASGLPPVTAALFFQGDALVGGGSGSGFGDGLRCIGHGAVRLGQRVTTGGASSFGPAAGDAPLSGFAGLPAEGGVRYYQVWYRNAAAFCSSATFNLTNALRVTWIP
jgi:glucose/arabinose dehydrogenase